MLLTTTNYGVQLLQTLGALLIVCVLAFLALRFAASRGLGQLGGKRLALVASLPLGPRQRLAIVQVDGRELLVGVADSGVTLLQTLPESPADANAPTSQVETPETTPLKQRFAELLLKKSA